MACGTCSTENGSPKGCKNNGTCGTDACNKLSVFDWLSNIQLPSHEKKISIVEVRFKNDRKAFFDNVNNLSISIGDVVAVEALSGHDIAQVTLVGELVRTQLKIKKIKKDAILKIFRKANQKDIDIWKSAREKEEDYKIEARKMATRMKLKMKICDVEFQGDASKVTFYYTSEGRVDFRELIKEFAGKFKTKIDMRQIGFRQESAKVGGIGSCGRELCCSTWLTDFRSVNTAAARYQQLSINPQKLAGQCGKLKCCLNYELDSYLDALNDFPSINTSLITEKGKANCLKIDVFRKKMWFVYEDSFLNWFEFGVDDVKDFITINRKGQKIGDLNDLQKIESKELITKDLISENSLERFDRKPNSNSKNRKNTNQSPNAKLPNSNQNSNTKNVQIKVNPQNQNTPKPKETGANVQNLNSDGTPKKKKKFYRKPKKD